MKNINKALCVVMIFEIIVAASFFAIPADDALGTGTITVIVQSKIPSVRDRLVGATVTAYASSSSSGPWTKLGTEITRAGGKVTFTGGDKYQNGYARFTVSYQSYGDNTYPQFGIGFQLDSNGSISTSLDYRSTSILFA